MVTAKEEIHLFFREALVYREWGYHLTNQKKYGGAIECFEKSLKAWAEEQDMRTLLGLCKAQTGHTRYDKAILTSEKCRRLDPQKDEALHLQVEALFNAGEFERSLLLAHQGLRQRLNPYEWDVHQGNETIEDTVGINITPNALIHLAPWIKKLEDHRKNLIAKLSEEEDEFEGIGEDTSKFKVNDVKVKQAERLRKLHRIIANLYLGHLATDKHFSQDIVEHPELVTSSNKQTSEELYRRFRINYAKSVYREDVLRMRYPLYVTLFERWSIPEGHKLMAMKEKHLKMNNIIVEADFLLRKLHALRMSKDYLKFFRYLERMKDKIDNCTTEMFPPKARCLNVLYKMIAWAYMDTRNLTCLDDENMKAIYMKHHMGIRVAKLPRECDLAWVPIVHRKEMHRIFRRRLGMASEPLELAWLFHEISKFLIQVHRPDMARFYAKKSRESAAEANSLPWMLNANHLMIRIEVGQHNKNEAREAAITTLIDARRLGIDFLIDFYERLLVTVIDGMDLDRMAEHDGIAIRQQMILEIMPEDMRATVDFLFRSMDVVPPKRRLSLMPGFKPIEKQLKLSCKRMTILPSPPKDPEKEARKALLKYYEPVVKRPGYVNFHKYE